jgi:hypothetical protein
VRLCKQRENKEKKSYQSRILCIVNPLKEKGKYIHRETKAEKFAVCIEHATKHMRMLLHFCIARPCTFSDLKTED